MCIYGIGGSCVTHALVNYTMLVV